MKPAAFAFVILLGSLVAGAAAETNVVAGMTVVCEDGVCTILEDASGPAGEPAAAPDEPSAEPAPPLPPIPSRIAQGYLDEKGVLAFLSGGTSGGEGDSPFAALSLMTLVLAFLGGLAMNLTPCVLPMIPVNLIVIGRSAARGAWYGLGIALAFGSLGALAAVGGVAFGTVQSSPWFNAAVAVVFAVLALALSGVFAIDFSSPRGGFAARRETMLPWLFAFFMGALSALLAGACVAPALVSVLLLTAKLHAEGRAFALALPFVLGLGMAAPWPFLGAGLRVLPRPGAWMVWVNRVFAAVVFGLAVWYGSLAWSAWRADGSGPSPVPGAAEATPETFAEALRGAFAASDRPVFVDCWASWCKNCAAMERGAFAAPEVRRALEGFSVIRLRAEDIRALRRLPGFGSVRGLPALAVFERER